MDNQLEHVLCCVGLRGDCHVVLEQAVKLAGTSGAKLHILHAVKSLDDDVMNTLRVNIRDKSALQGLMQRRIDDAQQQLEEKLENFLSLNANEREALSSRIASMEVVEGYPAKVIVNSASKLGCDLIVMAANKHGFTVSYVGKVTRGVLKRSHVPVVVVPPPK